METTQNDQIRHTTYSDTIRRDDISFLNSSSAEFIDGPRFTVAVGRRVEGEARIAHKLKFFCEEFAYKMREVLAKDWEIAIVTRRV